MTDNIDDLIEQIQADELRDGLEEHEFVSIGDFARAHRVRPQLVHYYIKAGKLRRVECCCGQLRLVTKEANAFWEMLSKEPPTNQEEGYIAPWLK